MYCIKCGKKKEYCTCPIVKPVEKAPKDKMVKRGKKKKNVETE